MVVSPEPNKILLLLLAASAALAFTMFWTMITKTWDELRTLRTHYNEISIEMARVDETINNIEKKLDGNNSKYQQ